MNKPKKQLTVISVRRSQPSAVPFFGSHSAKAGDTLELDDRVPVRVLVNESKGAIEAEIISFIVEHIDSISTGILSAYIYDRVKGRQDTVMINNKPIPLNKQAIEHELNLSNEGCKDEKDDE